MDKTDIQFYIGISVAFTVWGVTILLFGLDKTGLFNTKFAWLYVLVGFIVAIVGLIFMFKGYFKLKKFSKSLN